MHVDVSGVTSVAEQVTEVFVPRANVEPEAGTQALDTTVTRLVTVAAYVVVALGRPLDGEMTRF